MSDEGVNLPTILVTPPWIFEGRQEEEPTGLSLSPLRVEPTIRWLEGQREAWLKALPTPRRPPARALPGPRRDGVDP